MKLKKNNKKYQIVFRINGFEKQKLIEAARVRGKDISKTIRQIVFNEVLSKCN